MARIYVGVTDYDWFSHLRALAPDEVNFWRPGGTPFKALTPGDLFLFKLHAPRHRIVGGGLFAYSTLMRSSLVWEAFEQKNGARTYAEMRARIEKYRRSADSSIDYEVGCILLEQPFFLPDELWFDAPEWSANIVSGKGYALEQASGRFLWERIQSALAVERPEVSVVAEALPRYGEPVLVLPRLGQGSFRIIVTDAYNRRCAATGEKVLPVLEAAHIRPYADGGEHRVPNGMLLRRDLHTLFDRGYMTVTPEHRIEVSRRLETEFNNGKEYLALHGREIAVPADRSHQPDREALIWHNENRFVA